MCSSHYSCLGMGASFIWLWRRPWHTFTAGHCQLTNGTSKAWSLYLYRYASSMYAEIGSQSKERPEGWLHSAPVSAIFLDLWQRLWRHHYTKYPQSVGACRRRMDWANAGQGHHPRLQSLNSNRTKDCVDETSSFFKVSASVLIQTFNPALSSYVWCFNSDSACVAMPSNVERAVRDNDVGEGDWSPALQHGELFCKHCSFLRHQRSN